MSLKAYQQTQQAAEDPVHSEYRLFGQVTGALLEARDKGYSGTQLMDALDWNRRLWSVLSTDCAIEGNGLPDTLRAGIISLAIFVGKHTSQVMKGAGDIDDLININKQIMEGLSMQMTRQQEAAPGEPTPSPAQKSTA